MTQELTPKQRLTQIEKILESAIKLSHSNTQKIDDTRKLVEANSEAIKAQDSKIDRLTVRMAEATELFLDSMRVIREMQSEIRDMQTEVREMQTEVRGLQVENRRILDHLFGEDDREENN